MRILILQLSDIHLLRRGDAVLAQAARIVDAVRGVESQADLCLLALTGDIAFSGFAEEYSLADPWLAELQAGMFQALSEVPVRVAAIPGNHDCDFRTPSPTRNAVLDMTLRDPASANDPASFDPATSIQSHFFAFRDRVAREGLNPDANRLYYEYTFFGWAPELGSLRVRCLNTAWLSQNPEVVGSLLYPASQIPPADGSDEFVLTMMHHPTHWLSPLNSRDVRTRLRATPGLLLTGHEHQFGAFSQTDHGGSSVLYIEGCALKPHGDDDSAPGFNAIVVDSDTRSFRVVEFAWDRTHFAKRPGLFSEWTPLATSVTRAGGEFPLSAEMRDYIRDAGMDLYHPTRGLLHLDDIYVYPDLREVDHLKPSNRIVRGEALLEFSGARERVLITGPRDIGKTALSKRLFFDSLTAGLIPVLVRNPRGLFHGDHRDERALLRLFEDQFAASGTAFLGLPRDRRVVIVDNFEEVPANIAPAVLALLGQLAGRTIVFVNDLAQHVHDLAHASTAIGGASHFTALAIEACGYGRREQLIERYVGLAAGKDVDRAEALRGEMRSVLDTALGTYYAPPFPFAIVALLQARAFNDQLNLAQSTYGYYYELLVKRSLAEAGLLEEYDVSLGYLTALVGALYGEGKRDWTQSWFVAFHSRFVERQGLALKFTDVEKALRGRGILVLSRDTYSFRYGYFYYFFASRFLAEGLTTEAGRAEVQRLSTRLSEEESANILLFLTHLSKDAAIIDPMLDQAARVFADADRATLERNTVDLGDLPGVVREAVYEDGPIDQSRLKYMEALDAPPSRDEADAIARLERSTDIVEVTQLVNRLYEGLRTIQILGQLLRNFPGTLTADQKRRITTAVYGVALRIIGFLQDLFRTKGEASALAISATIRWRHPQFTDEQVFRRTLDTLSWYFFGSVIGITQRTAISVGSPLLEPIFAELERLDPVPAIKLISIAIRLQRYGFPTDDVLELATEFQNNDIATRVLTGVVLNHFHLFRVDFDAKQKVCARLGVPFKVQAPQQQRRTQLLGPKP